MSTRLRTGFGRKQSTLLATPSTGSTITESSRRHLMNSLPVKSEREIGLHLFLIDFDDCIAQHK
jgi:hypothetical protein